MYLGSFLRKRCCFDKLMYVRSIGFTLRRKKKIVVSFYFDRLYASVCIDVNCG